MGRYSPWVQQKKVKGVHGVPKKYWNIRSNWDWWMGPWPCAGGIIGGQDRQEKGDPAERQRKQMEWGISPVKLEAHKAAKVGNSSHQNRSWGYHCFPKLVTPETQFIDPRCGDEMHQKIGNLISFIVQNCLGEPGRVIRFVVAGRKNPWWKKRSQCTQFIPLHPRSSLAFRNAFLPFIRVLRQLQSLANMLKKDAGKVGGTAWGPWGPGWDPGRSSSFNARALRAVTTQASAAAGSLATSVASVAAPVRKPSGFVWKPPFLMGKSAINIYKWPFSIAMLNYQRVL